MIEEPCFDYYEPDDYDEDAEIRCAACGANYREACEENCKEGR